jgi:feruloyl esterase
MLRPRSRPITSFGTELKTRAPPFARFAVGLCPLLLAPAVAWPDSGMTVPQSCAALSGAHVAAGAIALPTTGAVIESAEFKVHGNYCAVIGTISPISASAPNIEFEVNLPSNWNGKALQMGGAAFDGVLVKATGPAVLEPDGSATPLQRGYATLGSDGGHKGLAPFDGSFGMNDEALLNYGKESVKKTHDVALELIRKHYGRAPRRFYFVGSSQGGHEALDAAARYPADYDGVISDYPAYNVTLLHLASLNVGKAIYGHDGAGWLSPGKTRLLVDAVYAACDTVALDGVRDGVISNVAGCNKVFNIETVRKTLTCRAGVDDDTCLTAAQIQAVAQITSPYRPGFAIAGMSEFPRWPLLEGAVFRVSTFGSRPVPSNPPTAADALLYNAGAATSRYILARDLAMDPLTFDPNSSDWLRARTQYVGTIMDVSDVDLTSFRKKGGKIILTHGTADDYITPYNTIAYYNQQRALQGSKNLDSFLRFYVIPGFGHGMGPFNARYEGLEALEAWVEKGRPPGDLIAIDVNPDDRGRTRPMCVYPTWPKYLGKGSVDAAQSYRCVER